MWFLPPTCESSAQQSQILHRGHHLPLSSIISTLERSPQLSGACPGLTGRTLLRLAGAAGAVASAYHAPVRSFQ
eukprot:7129648-Lingulodinium_polyedra.AAC.1